MRARLIPCASLRPGNAFHLCIQNCCFLSTQKCILMRHDFLGEYPLNRFDKTGAFCHQVCVNRHRNEHCTYCETWRRLSYILGLLCYFWQRVSWICRIQCNLKTIKTLWSKMWCQKVWSWLCFGGLLCYIWHRISWIAKDTMKSQDYQDILEKCDARWQKACSVLNLSITNLCRFQWNLSDLSRHSWRNVLRRVKKSWLGLLWYTVSGNGGLESMWCNKVSRLLRNSEAIPRLKVASFGSWPPKFEKQFEILFKLLSHMSAFNLSK